MTIDVSFGYNGPGVAGLEMDDVGGALLVCGAGGATAGLRAVTRALAAAHTEIVVSCAPGLDRRSDFYDAIANVILGLPRPTDRAAGRRVRLVPLGNVSDPEARERGIAYLASTCHRTVVAPLGPVLVATDGTTAVGGPEAATGGWLACDPEGWTERQQSWSPAPAWRAVGPPDPRQLPSGLSVHAIPGGLWVVPDDLTPGRAGVVGSLPRPGSPGLTVFVGGCGRPLSGEDVAAAIERCHLDEHDRLVLLPQAVTDTAPLTELELAFEWASIDADSVQLVSVTPPDLPRSTPARARPPADRKGAEGAGSGDDRADRLEPYRGEETPRRGLSALLRSLPRRSRRDAAPVAAPDDWIGPVRPADVSECGPADRERLRQALGHRYDRYVDELRPAVATVEGDDESVARALAGLVAVRAYLDGWRDDVNAYLRGGTSHAGVGAGSGAESVVAACARSGLERLPVVFGCVYLPGPDPDVRGMAEGDDISEPAFVDASLALDGLPEEPVRVVWSSTARRVDAAVSAGAPAVIFPPGSRFVYLAGEDTPAGRRIFLADHASVADPAHDRERLLAWLRKVVRQEPR